MTNNEELLMRILRLSHSQVEAGKSFSQEEAERFLDRAHSFPSLRITVEDLF